MGRPPSNGGPTFRFNQAEVTEMEAILQAHHTAMPEREVLIALADKFSSAPERSGKIQVHMKQVWNWFQNRRYAIRAKAAKAPGKLLVSSMPRDNSPILTSMPRDNSAILRNGPQVPPQSLPNPSAPVGTMPLAPQHPPASSGKSASENSQMEFEAKSARDGAWYDVSTFLSHRSLEMGDPEVLVRFSGFGPEEDEWVNIRKHVRQRSLPCESSECVAVLPGDLILCFQEGKEQALYFDAHVLDAQRRRHDVRGCRCRFLVRYDHDQSEEIVALRKICRRPETDYRLQQLHALNESAPVNQNKTNPNIHMGSTLRVYPPPTAEVTQKPPQKVESSITAPQPSLPEITQKPPQKVESSSSVTVTVTVTAPPPQPSLPETINNKLQDNVELVVLPPKINLPQSQQKVEPMVSAPPAQQTPVVGAASIGNLPESKDEEKVDSLVPAFSHSNNLPEVSEAKTQEKVELVVPAAPSHSNLPEDVVSAAPTQSNPSDIILEGTAQQTVEHVDVGPMPMPSESGGEGKVDQKVEAPLPEPSATNIGGENKVEPVKSAPGNVGEVMEVTVEPEDVEMVSADKESNSGVPVDNATETSVPGTIVSDQDQEMQEAS